MGMGIVKETEMGGGDPANIQRAEAGQTLPPLSEVEFGRGRGDADVIHPRKAHPPHIPRETNIFEEIGHVMGRMTGRVERCKLEVTDREGIAIGEGGEFVGRDGEKLAPEGFHAFAINAFGADEEALGVEQVWEANFVNVDVGALLGKPAGGPGMVEVDMGEKGVGDVGRGEAVRFQGGGEGGNGGAGAGFDEDGSAGMGDEESGDGVGESLEVEVKEVNLWHGWLEGEKGEGGDGVSFKKRLQSLQNEFRIELGFFYFLL